MDTRTTAAPRFSLKLMMRFRRKGEDRWRDTKTLNVSSSGAVFLTKEILQPSSSLEVEIFMKSGDVDAGVIRASSEVVRQNAGDGGLVTVIRHIKYEMQSDTALDTPVVSKT
jgi:hypothetical protein